MSELNNDSISMLIDTKKNRIRIYKSVIHKIGNPKAVLILINPKTQIVAIKAANGKNALQHTHLVTDEAMSPDNSVEFYSKSLIRKIKTSVQDMREEGSYRVDGMIIEKENMVVFSLSTLMKK